jgi:hypothetical protein
MINVLAVPRSIAMSDVRKLNNPIFMISSLLSGVQ